MVLYRGSSGDYSKKYTMRIELNSIPLKNWGKMECVVNKKLVDVRKKCRGVGEKKACIWFSRMGESDYSGSCIGLIREWYKSYLGDIEEFPGRE